MEVQTIGSSSKVTKFLLTVDEAASAIGIGKTLLYEMLMREEIASIKLGRRRLVPVAALREFVAHQLCN